MTDGLGINTLIRDWSGKIYKIQDLEPGMSLIHSADGSIWDDYATPTVIKNIYSQANDLYRFYLWNGKSIDFAKDHLLCLTDNQNNHIEMTVSEYLHSDENIKKYAFYRTHKYWDRNLIEYITHVLYTGIRISYHIELEGEQTFYSEDYLILHC